MKEICLMGGTFDPVHFGHLVVAEEVRQRFHLDKVVFIPAGKPPHKTDKVILDAQHRVNMIRLAIASNPYFEISTIEVERRGLSYTVDTIEQLRRSFQVESIYFITGADAILEILTWKDVERLLSMAYLIAATRPGYDLNNLEETLKSLPTPFMKRILPLEVPALAISSSDIRKRVREGKSIKYLLPESVEGYIYHNNIYVAK
ncbi:nicotinate-nucleotide adenylyltransferase [Desulfotomaculum sp. 1211_IL3151]|uniref:nicotinate-nucleotide adenylyltransferase n=1 Tax=Desulfotomaculum sp. 1211_IL3151 TaxID=3084055 RepID=UPI002FDB14DC